MAVADLCQFLREALDANLEAQGAYQKAQAAMAVGIEDRLERDIGLDLWGFVIDESRHHERTIRRLIGLFCEGS